MLPVEQQLIDVIDSILADPAVPRERKAAWRDVQRVAKRVAKSKKPAAAKAVGRPPTVTPAMVAQMHALRKKEQTMQQIADSLGLNKSQVSRALKESR